MKTPFLRVLEQQCALLPQVGWVWCSRRGGLEHLDCKSPSAWKTFILHEIPPS
jgi:hypothetical protein